MKNSICHYSTWVELSCSRKRDLGYWFCANKWRLSKWEKKKKTRFLFELISVSTIISCVWPTQRQAGKWEAFVSKKGRVNVSSDWRLLVWGSKTWANQKWGILGDWLEHILCFSWLVLSWKHGAEYREPGSPSPFWANCCSGYGWLPRLVAAEVLNLNSIVTYGLAIVLFILSLSL